MAAPNERTPATAISVGSVILFYVDNGMLTKRLFPYGAESWENAVQMIQGIHPDTVDQIGLFWLTWEWQNVIYFATSSDAGRNFTAPTAISTPGNTPGIDILPNGFAAIAFIAQLPSSSSSSSFSSSSSSSFSSSSSSESSA